MSLLFQIQKNIDDHSSSTSVIIRSHGFYWL